MSLVPIELILPSYSKELVVPDVTVQVIPAFAAAESVISTTALGRRDRAVAVGAPRGPRPERAPVTRGRRRSVARRLDGDVGGRRGRRARVRRVRVYGGAGIRGDHGTTMLRMMRG